MTEYERKKIDMEMKSFTSRNFEKPLECKNLEQIQFYVKELCTIIEQYQEKYNYVPNWAYGLLAQYNAQQNNILLANFQSSYS